MREIPVPKLAKIVFWVDDQPENNYYHARKLELKNISVVFCTSTQMALSVIKSYRWMIYMENSCFKIVTDMVRMKMGR